LTLEPTETCPFVNKYTALLLLGFWLLASGLRAQRYTRARQWEEQAGTWQLCVDAGTSRYMGDLCETWDLAHLRLGATLGGSLQYRLSPRFTARADARAYYIYGSQEHTRVWYNNLSFRAFNADVWAGLQFDVFHQDAVRESIPYVFAGLGLTYMTPYVRYKDFLVDLAKIQTEGVKYSRYAGIVRYGLGWPLLTRTRTTIGLELSYTHCLSDYLDDVSDRYPDYSKLENPFAGVLSDRAAEIGQPRNLPGAQRGNNKANDGYYLLTARFAYTLSTDRSRRYGRHRR
jgi:hypothetical protein